MDASSMLAPALPADPYDELPEPVRMTLTRREYLWLSDDEKARLVQSLCDPDPEN